MVTEWVSTFDVQPDPLHVPCYVRAVCTDMTKKLPRSHMQTYVTVSKLKLLEASRDKGKC